MSFCTPASFSLVGGWKNGEGVLLCFLCKFNSWFSTYLLAGQGPPSLSDQLPSGKELHRRIESWGPECGGWVPGRWVEGEVYWGPLESLCWLCPEHELIMPSISLKRSGHDPPFLTVCWVWGLVLFRSLHLCDPHLCAHYRCQTWSASRLRLLRGMHQSGFGCPGWGVVF